MVSLTVGKSWTGLFQEGMASSAPAPHHSRRRSGQLDQGLRQEPRLVRDRRQAFIDGQGGDEGAVLGLSFKTAGTLLKTLELDECFYLAHLFLAAAYSQLGKLKEALAALEEAQKQGEQGTRILGWLALVNAQLGRKAKVLAIVRELEKLSQSRYVCPLDLARVYLGISDGAQTLTYLEKAAERRCGRLISAVVDPNYDLVRRDPRFARLRARMNLP